MRFFRVADSAEYFLDFHCLLVEVLALSCACQFRPCTGAGHAGVD